MAKTILMNISEGDECRVALVAGGILHDYFVDRPSQLTHVGDVYRGVITNVESAIQAGFIDIGYKKNAFMHISDTISAYHPGVDIRDIYGTDPVEVRDVEDIDFEERPEEDEDEDENGRGTRRGIKADEIEAKKPFTRSKEEQGIRETVDVERDAGEAKRSRRGRRGGRGRGRGGRGRGEGESQESSSTPNEVKVESNAPARKKRVRKTDAALAVDTNEKKTAKKAAKKTVKKAAKKTAKKAAKKASKKVAKKTVKKAAKKVAKKKVAKKAAKKVAKKVAKKAAKKTAKKAAKKVAKKKVAKKKVAKKAAKKAAKKSAGRSRADSYVDGFSPLGGDIDDRMIDPLAKAHRNGEPLDHKPMRFLRPPLPKVQDTLVRGQEMLVQVTRAAQGGKGPSVTTYISLPGRYMVLMPNTSKCGVSRKIEDPKMRRELKRALRRLHIPDGMGVIIRTAAADRPIEELQRDLNYLLKIWNSILKDVNVGGKAPSCSYKDGDPAIRTVRDYFNPDVDEILIDDKVVYERVKAFFEDLMPDYADRVIFYDKDVPLFAAYGLEPQIEHLFDKKVNMPSGGYLFIEQTEALVAIDVNSGRFLSESDAELTAYKTNIEAIPEIARQVRLRDLGGIVVCDFIDMADPKHRREVETLLMEELSHDRARVKVAPTSPFGLVELTRQRVRPSIQTYTYSDCKSCNTFGYVMSDETQALRALRAIRLTLAQDESHGAVLQAPVDVLNFMHSNLRDDIQAMTARYNKPISFEWAPSLGAQTIALYYINSRGDRTNFDYESTLRKYTSQDQVSNVEFGGSKRRRRKKKKTSDGSESNQQPRGERKPKGEGRRPKRDEGSRRSKKTDEPSESADKARSEKPREPELDEDGNPIQRKRRRGRRGGRRQRERRDRDGENGNSEGGNAKEGSEPNGNREGGNVAGKGNSAPARVKRRRKEEPRSEAAPSRDKAHSAMASAPRDAAPARVKRQRKQGEQPKQQEAKASSEGKAPARVKRQRQAPSEAKAPAKAKPAAKPARSGQAVVVKAAAPARVKRQRKDVPEPAQAKGRVAKKTTAKKVAKKAAPKAAKKTAKKAAKKVAKKTAKKAAKKVAKKTAKKAAKKTGRKSS